MFSPIDVFLSFMLFLIGYGTYLKIWNQSRTTFLVIVSIFLIAFSAKYFQEEILLIETSVVMFMLFVRAVFRKYIKKSKFKDLFYA